MRQSPQGEVERIAALESLDVLDTSPEPAFDELVQAAALLCDVPVSVVSLIDADRQWFKASVGLHEISETSRDTAFCNHTILGDGILEVVDATQDPRFSNSPLVTGQPHIRFYAGVPLTMDDGARVGTLCVIDHAPRQLSSRQKHILQHLSRAVVLALNARRAAYELVQSQSRYQALSDLSPLEVFSTNGQGDCTYVNERWQSIFGIEEQDALGSGWCGAIHPDDREEIVNRWQANTSQRTCFDMEFRLRHDNGDVLTVRGVSRPVLTDNGEVSGHIGSVEDVSERVQAHRALQDEHRRLEAVIKGTGVGCWEWNLQTDEMRGDARWWELLGVSPEDTTSSTREVWKERRHPDDIERMTTMMNRHIAGELEAFEYEARMWHGDGRWVWLSDHGRILTRTAAGQPEWMFGTLQDISHRKEQESALLQNERLLNETGVLADVGGFEYDIGSDQLRWSDQYCLLHGMRPGYQPNLHEALSFYLPEGRPTIQAAIDDAIDTGQGWDLELRVVRSMGETIWVRVVGHVEHCDGKPVRLLGAMQSITDHVQQRHHLAEAHERIAIATDSGEIGVWEWHIDEGRIRWSERMFALHGLSAEQGDMPYDVWIDHVYTKDREYVARTIQGVIEGEGDLDIEFRIRWADQYIHHLRVAAHVVRDENNQAIRLLGVGWDITTLRKLNSTLSAQAESLRVTLQTIGEAVITTDAMGLVTWQNPVAEQLTGWLSQDAIGQPLSHVLPLIDENTREMAVSPISTCLEFGNIVGLTRRTVLISRNGHEYGIENSASPILDQQGSILGAMIVFHDVTEQRRMAAEMKYLASHDALTGLLNRTEFETRLGRLMNHEGDGDSEHSLLFLNLDRFKLINDAGGHVAGDQLLVKIANLLCSMLRPGDTLARLGGDEFGIILEHRRGDQASRIAQQICYQVDAYRFVFNDQPFRIGSSIGLVPLDRRWSDTSSAIQAADTACHAAKEAGKNRVHIWFDSDEDMQLRQEDMQWARRLEQAFDEDHFELHAQHIKPLTHVGQGIHAEILIRLRTPDGIVIPPELFMPAAERFNLVTRMDRRVLAQALSTLRSFLDHTAVELFCVNLSGQSVGDPEFHQDALALLKSSGRRICQRLCLEITETAAVKNMAKAATFIEQVRALGVRVALDDFGAGASSFGYLKSLPVDFLKIDGQFIQNMMSDPLDDIAVKCFIDVARVMGLKTIAEYVSSPEILQCVRAMGIDYAQGFLIHEPESVGNLPGGGVGEERVGGRASSDEYHGQVLDQTDVH
ncbi:PAS domain-containing protein [Granulosicoccus sp. 3-233]|uniref:PAS domain-containing protein n=1 Tax=Granulosicoccus sp. 3-233 TaxID=3417969 RepID=UPI003D32F16F